VSTSRRKVNEKVILSRISRLREYVQALEELRREPYEEFLSNYMVRYTSERCLHLAIECAINIGNHIISALQLRKPEEYHDIAIILGEAGVIPREFAEQLAKMIRFRNILVHNYVRLDPSKVYSFMQERLEDFELFIKYIIDFLKSSRM